MNGQSRASIYPGLHVSIVLKEDQPTGRLTHGIVQDILTRSPYHPRGIKVRLADGCVGRVRALGEPIERIYEAPEQIPDDLIVLIVQDENGNFVVDDSGAPGEEESEIGFTAPIRKGSNGANAAARMLFNETGLIGETRHLFSERASDLDVHVFHCFVERKAAGIPRDRWRIAEDVAAMSRSLSLTPFSAMVFERLSAEYELVVEEA